MKHTFITIFLLAALASRAQIPTAIDFKKLDWLQGTWTRTNVKAGSMGHERWVKISENEWRGWGVSMSGKDTTYLEKLKLISKNNQLFYVADVPENKGAVEFKFTELTDHSFICENPEHDFPKRISYVLDGNKIKAIISGNGKSVGYLFEKSN